MVLLVLLLLALLGDTGFFFSSGQHLRLGSLAQLLEPVFLFLAEVGEFLDLGLIEAVDDGVFALGDQDLFDFSLVFEADLAGGHAAVFFEVGPGGVDYGYVVFFVSWGVLVVLGGGDWCGVCTFDGVGLG